MPNINVIETCLTEGRMLTREEVVEWTAQIDKIKSNMLVIGLYFAGLVPASIACEWAPVESFDDT